MSSRVLALKWRPQVFASLVGQEHITTALINSLDSGRIHHAYLFCGTRGVGKTTLARILAKCLSCEKGISSSPCNECSACKSIDQGNYPDLIEVDAASRTKVEDTRDLLGDMQFAPSKGRYKIYLIDEVHMLSNHSFNALLKTLEEPLPHIIFIFATTETQKLPVTVVSRCLKFNLKAIFQEEIIAKLAEILKAEAIDHDEDSLILLSHYAKGSMRDALSLTDQAIAYCNGKIEVAKIEKMFGVDALVSPELILEYLANGDIKPVFDIFKDMEAKGVSFTDLWDEIIICINRLSLELFDDNKSELAGRFHQAELQLLYQIALLTKRELAYAPSMRSASEMGLIKMLTMQPLANLGTKLGANAVPVRYSQTSATTEPGSQVEEAAVETKPKSEDEQSTQQVQEELKVDPQEEPKIDIKDAAPELQKEEQAEEQIEEVQGETKPELDDEQSTQQVQEERKADLQEEPETEIKNSAPGTQAEKQPEPQLEKQKEETLQEPAQAETNSQADTNNTAELDSSANSNGTDYTEARAWASLLDRLNISGLLKSTLGDTRIVEIHGNMWVMRCLSNVKASISNEMLGKIEDAISREISHNISLTIEIGQVDETPNLLVNTIHSELVANVKQDNMVKKIISKFDGQLEEDSVQSLNP